MTFLKSKIYLFALTLGLIGALGWVAPGYGDWHARLDSVSIGNDGVSPWVPKAYLPLADLSKISLHSTGEIEEDSVFSSISGEWLDKDVSPGSNKRIKLRITLVASSEADSVQVKRSADDVVRDSILVFRNKDATAWGNDSVKSAIWVHGADSVQIVPANLEPLIKNAVYLTAFFPPLAQPIELSSALGSEIVLNNNWVPRAQDSVIGGDGYDRSRLRMTWGSIKIKGKTEEGDSVAWGVWSGGGFDSIGWSPGGNAQSKLGIPFKEKVAARIRVVADSMTFDMTEKGDGKGWLFKKEYSSEDLQKIVPTAWRSRGVVAYDGRTNAQLDSCWLMDFVLEFPETEEEYDFSEGYSSPLTGVDLPRAGEKSKAFSVDAGYPYEIKNNTTNWHCGAEGSLADADKININSNFYFAERCSVSVVLIAKNKYRGSTNFNFAFNKKTTSANWDVEGLVPEAFKNALNLSYGAYQTDSLDTLRVWFKFDGPEFIEPTITGPVTGLPNLVLGADLTSPTIRVGAGSVGIKAIEWVGWSGARDGDSVALVQKGKVQADSVYGAGVRIITSPNYAFVESPELDLVDWASKFAPQGFTVSKVGKGKTRSGAQKGNKDGDSINFSFVYPAIAQPTLSKGVINGGNAKVYGVDSVLVTGIEGSADIRKSNIQLHGAYSSTDSVKEAGQLYNGEQANIFKVVVIGKDGERVNLTTQKDSVSVKGDATARVHFGTSDGVTTGTLKIGGLMGLSVENSPYKVSFGLADSVLNIRAYLTEPIEFSVKDSLVAPRKLTFSSGTNADSARLPKVPFTYDSLVPGIGLLADSTLDGGKNPTTVNFKVLGWRKGTVNAQKRLETLSEELLGGDGKYTQAGHIYASVVQVQAEPNYSFADFTNANLVKFADSVWVRNASGNKLGDSILLSNEKYGFGVSGERKDVFTFGVAHNYVAQPVITPATSYEIPYGTIDTVLKMTSSALPASDKAVITPTISLASLPNATFGAQVISKGARTSIDSVVIGGELKDLLPEGSPYEFSINFKDNDAIWGTGIDTTITKVKVVIKSLDIPKDSISNLPKPVLGSLVPASPRALTLKHGGQGIKSINIVHWNNKNGANLNNLNVLSAGAAFPDGEKVYAVVVAEAADGYVFNSSGVADVNFVGGTGATAVSAVVPGTQGGAKISKDGKTYTFAIEFPAVAQPTITAVAKTDYVYGTTPVEITLNLPDGFPISATLVVDSAWVGSSWSAAGVINRLRAPITLTEVGDGKVSGTFSLTGLETRPVNATALDVGLAIWGIDGSAGVKTTTTVKVTVTRARAVASAIKGTIPTPSLNGSIAAISSNLDVVTVGTAANATITKAEVTGWKKVDHLDASGNPVLASGNALTSGKFGAGQYAAIVKVTAGANWTFSGFTSAQLAGLATSFKGEIGSSAIITDGIANSTALGVSGAAGDVFTFAIVFGEIGAPVITPAPITDYVFASTAARNITFTFPEEFKNVSGTVGTVTATVGSDSLFKGVSVTKSNGVVTGSAAIPTTVSAASPAFTKLSVTGSPHAVRLNIVSSSGTTIGAFNINTDLAVTVVPKTITNATIGFDNGAATPATGWTGTYDGTDQVAKIKPVITDGATTGGLPASYADKKLTLGTDYNIVWGETRDVKPTPTGTLTALNEELNMFEVVGIGNYGGSKFGTFTINKLPAASLPTITTLAAKTVSYAEAIKLQNLFEAGDLFKVSAEYPGTEYVFELGAPVAGAKIEDNVLTVPETKTTVTLRLTAKNNNFASNPSSSTNATLIVLDKDAATIAVGQNLVDKSIVKGYERDSLLYRVSLEDAKPGQELVYEWFRILPGKTAISAGAKKDSVLNLDTEKSQYSGLKEGDVVQYYVVVKEKNGDVLPVTSRTASVTLRSTDAPASVASVGSAFANQAVTYAVSQTEFKVAANPEGAVSVVNAVLGGVAADYKLIKLNYTKDGVTVRNEVAGAVPTTTVDFAASKGVTGVGVYSVTAELRNLNPNSSGFGLLVTKTIDFTVRGKSLSDAVITFLAPEAGADRVFNEKAKTVAISVTDGGLALEPGVHYTVTLPNDLTNAGEKTVTITGINNYSGTKSNSFTITPLPVEFEPTSVANVEPFKKEFDNTTAVPLSGANLALAFVDASTKTPVSLLTSADYTVTGAVFSNKDVGKNKTVTVTVELSGTANSNNYSLATKTFTVSGNEIEKGTPDVKFLTITPAALRDTRDWKVYEDGSVKTATAAWITGVTNGASGNPVVDYGTTDGKAPSAVGLYNVVAKVPEGTTFKALDVSLGSLTILEMGAPLIPNIPDTSYRSGSSVILRATASVQVDSGVKEPTLSYQWYEVAANGTDSIKRTGSATQTVNTKTVGTVKYFVWVSYKSGTVTKAARSNDVTVTVKPEPVTLKDAEIRANQTYEYTGRPFVLTASDFAVTLAGQPLQADVDYEISGFRNNTNAGEAVVTIKGKDGYKETATGYFTITKKQIDITNDLRPVYNVTYDGKPKSLEIGPANGVSGIGDVTVTYEPADSERVDFGSWAVSITVKEGLNFQAIETPTLLPNPFVIRKALPDTTMWSFYVPEEVAWTEGGSYGIAEPTPKDLGLFYTGRIEVRYNGSTTVPTEEGDYAVSLFVFGDKNFSAYDVDLGIMSVFDATKTLSGNREIPTANGGDVGVIAPVAKVSGNITVGPNPTSRGGKTTIYWNGSKTVKGKLVVFNTAGQKVGKVEVSGRGAIGAWNTTTAAEGTYLIKGVLKAADGSKVQVSTLVGVTR